MAITSIKPTHRVGETEPPAAPAPPTRPAGHSRLALGLALYNLLVGFLAAALMVDLLVGGPFTGGGAMVGADSPVEVLLVRHIGFISLGAAIGAVLHSLFGLWVHAAVLNDFRSTFAGSYLLGPFGAALLGFGTFLVLQAGLLALGGDASAGDDPLQASLFYGAIGVLVGLGFDAVLMRIDGVTRQLFGAPEGSFLRSAHDSAQRRLSSAAPPPSGAPDAEGGEGEGGGGGGES